MPALILHGNIIHRQLVEHLQLPTILCTISLTIKVMDNKPIVNGLITHQSIPIMLQVGLFYTEEISLFVTSTLNIIFGFPWLQDHNPQISWPHKDLTSWSFRCLRQCIMHHLTLPCHIPSYTIGL